MTAKYIHLANILREQILHNTGAIYKLPSENSLCNQYHVSRQTVRAALQVLSEDGLIEKRHGSGSYSTGLGSMKKKIGIVVNNADEYTTPYLLADIESVLGEKGYSTTIHSTFSKVEIEHDILEELKKDSIRGLIVEGTRTSLPNPNLDLYRHLTAKGISILFVGGYYPALTPYIHIKDDNHYGGHLLTKHLLELGHTRIAGIFKMDDIQGLERYSGYISALQEFGLPVKDELITWYTASSLESLESKSDTSFLTSFLRKRRDLYSAVICYNDEIAYWLIREMRYANIRVPEDVSVVSFDNSYMSDLNSIRITTLSHKKHELGTVAATTLLRMIQGEPVISQELSWQLITRGSDTAPWEP